jgi:hypothetical protein
LNSSLFGIIDNFFNFGIDFDSKINEKIRFDEILIFEVFIVLFTYILFGDFNFSFVLFGRIVISAEIFKRLVLVLDLRLFDPLIEVFDNGVQSLPFVGNGVDSDRCVEQFGVLSQLAGLSHLEEGA